MKTKTFETRLVICIIVSEILCNVGASQIFRELGPGPQNTGAIAYGVSNDGTLVGGMYYEPGGNRAARWRITGELDEIPLPLGSDRSVGWEISGTGEFVVGVSSLSTTNSQRAFRWSEASGTEVIPVLPGYTYNTARSASADGNVVVGLAGRASGFHGYRWTESGVLQDLGALGSPLNSSQPLAVSGDGSTVVGQGYLATTPKAFRWTETKGMEELLPLPGNSNAVAVSANHNGSLIVGSSSNPGRDAVVWDSAGVVTNLGEFTTEALDLTDDGSMIVGYGVDQGETAFLWTNDGGAQNLNDYIAGLGVDLTNWRLERATSISPDGRTIVGYGRKNGRLEGWLFSFSVTGDFSSDGILDCTDVDALVAAIVNGIFDPTFDLSGDGIVDASDLTEWLAVAGSQNLPNEGAYLSGDANLDGFVDATDFNIWNANKFTSNPAWCAGDFNADGHVDISDFNTWNVNKFLSSDVTALPETNGTRAVPEPAQSAVIITVLAILACQRRNPWEIRS